MFGWLSDLWNLWEALKTFVSVGFVGGVAAALGFGIACLYITRNVTGLIGAVAAGVVIVGLAGSSTVGALLAAQKAQEQITQLKAEAAAKAQKLAEIVATNKQLTEFLDAGREAAAENAKVMADLQRRIDEGGVPEDCGFSKEFIDDLNKLR